MNILFVCSAKSWGGNEKWTTMAMKTLSEQHHIFFFGRKKKLAENFGSGYIKAFAPMIAYFDLYSFFKAWHFVKRNRIDCIVSTKKKEYFIFGIISRIMKIRHLIRLGIVRDMNRPLWHNLVYNKLNDGIIANAHRIEKNLRSAPFMMNKPVFVLYNAIPGLSGLLSIKKEVPDKFTIISTGMLTRRKGFHILTEAVAALPDNMKQNIKVVYIGQGREKEDLETQISSSVLNQTIKLAGFQKEPSSFLRKASLFVLLSENEGISNALLEAMACGVPVLTTDSGGSTEFIDSGQNGFIVERNAETVANKLIELIQMPNNILKDIGKSGQKTVSGLFAEEVFRKNLFEIFNS
ncbi:glycosyltransferase [Saccharicrinis sp. FJH54]|uniref:glycosyltransferase n=1 Tax=Saccharicrinis sp. FJH54 TaxID=3344665 RepID=UPI0035D47B2A